MRVVAVDFIPDCKQNGNGCFWILLLVCQLQTGVANAEISPQATEVGILLYQ